MKGSHSKMKGQHQHHHHQNRHQNRRRHALGLASACGLAVLSSGGDGGQAKAEVALSPETQQAMVESIQDEYRAKAFYQAVIDKFGPIRPFSNIVQAEDRHAQRWVALFNQYNLPIPEDTFAGNVAASDSLKEACELAIAAEIDNVKMYDRFLEFVQEPDLRATFTQLRHVSENKHKRAFERCANR